MPMPLACVSAPRPVRASHECHSRVRSLRLGWLIAIGLCLACAATPALAQTVEAVSTRLGPGVVGDGASGDNFGVAVAVDGTMAAVGAYGDVVVVPGAPNGVAQGSVYLYSRQPDDQWQQTQKLVPTPIGEDGDNFGVALALQADQLVIAAPRRAAQTEAEAGSVFVYGPGVSAWTQRQELRAPLPVAGERFGTALALSGEWLAVGAPNAAADGRVDLYRRQPDAQYQYVASLRPQASSQPARFGAALAMHEDRLLIGAPGADGAGALYASQWDGQQWSAATRLALPVAADSELGAALVIDGDDALVGAPGVNRVHWLQWSEGLWAPLTTLMSSSSAPGDRYGQAVGISAGSLSVGAVAALGGEGAVYVYPRKGALLGEAQRLDNADGANANRFGTALAHAADGVMVGSDLAQVGPNRLQGAAYWYRPVLGGVVLVDQLDSGDGAYLDRYGSAVAVDGDTAMVGAFLEDTDAGADAGRVHWFQRIGGTWVRQGALVAADAQIEDRFGVAIDIDGDLAVVGAYWDVIGDHVDQGSVYVYRRVASGWVQEAKLVASDGRERDLFGFAVSLQGQRLLVGARGARVPFVDQGVAYVYERQAPGLWSQQARLDLPTGAAFVYFGASVALSGDLALIGAPGLSAPGVPGAGAALVYARAADGQWSLRGELRAPLMRPNAGFGFSVDADRKRLLVGAFQDGAAAQGAAYLYRRDLKPEATLVAAQAQGVELMGVSVALSGNSVVLGASGYDVLAREDAGAVHVYERYTDGWRESRLLVAADAEVDDNFGRAVATGQGSVLIGAPYKAGDNPQEGMAYAAHLSPLFADDFED